MIYHFTLPYVVKDRDAGGLVRNQSGGVLVDRDGTEVEATTELGVPVTIATDNDGTTLPFLAPISYGRVRFGTSEAGVWSDETMDAAPAAEAARAAAEAALAQVAHIGRTATELTYFYLDAAGEPWVSATPIVSGGGRPRIVDGEVVLFFPI